MAKSKEEIRVALDGDVSVAPVGVGVTLPTSLAALDSDFVDLGYQSEDGVSFSVTPNVDEIRGWQSQDALRRIVTSRDLSFGFTALQWNITTFATAYGGGEWTEPTAGVYRYDPPADEDALVDYSVVLDFYDGDFHGRLVVLAANITDAVETSFQRSSAATLPIAFSGVTPESADRNWYFLSNDEALNPTP
jgi:hypothetical protein